MAVVLSTNFTGEPGTSFLGEGPFIVTRSVGLVAAHYGTAVRFIGDSGWLTYSFPSTTKRVFSRIYKISGAPSVNSQIFQVRSDSAALSSVSIRTTGQLAVHSGGSLGTVAAITTDPVPIGSEFRVVYTHDGSAFTVDVYPDRASTVPQQTIVGTVASGAFTTARDGNPTAGGLEGVTLDMSWPMDDNSSDPGTRRYVYLEADSKMGIVPKTVNAVVRDENMPAGTKTYSVDWGDGTSSGPQAGREFSHRFTKPGDWAMIPRVTVL